MKKQLLLAGFAGLILSATAGDGGTRNVAQQAVHTVATPVKKPQFGAIPVEHSASRAERSLSKITIGSSGNLYSVVRSDANFVDADDSLKAVTVTFRTDDTVFHGSNSSRYRFNLSKDGGSTWQGVSKELNKNNVYANTGINGRYPQGLIYRAPGITDADSAYLIYTGTWHNGSAGIWSGESRGAAKLNYDSTTFTEHDPNIAQNLGANLVIASSLVKAGNKFFNLNERLSSTNYSTENIVTGLVLMRGQWNNTTRDVVWTDSIIPISTETYPSSSSISIFGGQAIAFDPTGQIGYWVFAADLTPGDGIYEQKPYYFKSTDGGANWEGPTKINLDSIYSFQNPGVDGNGNPTGVNILGDLDVVVDSAGIPHIAILAGLTQQSDFSQGFYTNYGLHLWDLTTGSTLCNSGFIANHLATVNATSSQFSFITSTSGSQTDNNRLQASRTEDGKHVFFFWSETDSAIASQLTDYNNPSPDLKGIGMDVFNAKATLVKNFTAGDPMFGGETTTASAGTAGGALFSSVSPITLTTGSGFNVPVTLTEVDYLHPSATSKSGDEPARHWYLQNIDFATAEFTQSIADNDPPQLTGVVDTIEMHLDSSLTVLLPTVTAFDCHDGDVTANILIDSSAVHTDSIGVYTLTYSVTDSAGNTRTETTTILVEAQPIALIGYSRTAGNKYTFRDSSLNLPTSRQWTFGNGSPPSTAYQVPKTFSVAGSVSVCLQVWNHFGTDSTCQDFDVVLGIQNVEMNNSIAVFPTTTSGNVTIEVNKAISDDMNIQVYSISGAVVSSDYTVKRNTATTTISLANLANGVYQLKIGNEKVGYAVKPVVIQK